MKCFEQGLKNYVWVRKFPITAYSKEEAIEQIKSDFDGESVMISGRDLSVDLQYLGTEKSNDYDKKMYEYMGNEYVDNPKKMNFPKETDKERKERQSLWATELD
tara:strand:- start:211 stop:522 length:312 start_codon:yes stop_codon:yes gene_type:complete